MLQLPTQEFDYPLKTYLHLGSVVEVIVVVVVVCSVVISMVVVSDPVVVSSDVVVACVVVVASDVVVGSLVVVSMGIDMAHGMKHLSGSHVLFSVRDPFFSSRVTGSISQQDLTPVIVPMFPHVSLHSDHSHSSHCRS